MRHHDGVEHDKAHEHGVLVESRSGAAWHYAASASEARTRWSDVLERVREHAGTEVTVRRVEFGQVVEELSLGASSPG